MKIRVLFTLSLLLLIAGLLSGCIPIVIVRTVVVTLVPPSVCTQAGCVDSLRVNVQGKLPEEFQFEATGSDGSRAASACFLDKLADHRDACDDPAVLYLGDYFSVQNFAPEAVTVHLTWEGGSLEQEFTPAYEWFYPNGPKCEPKCKQGQVELEIP